MSHTAVAPALEAPPLLETLAEAVTDALRERLARFELPDNLRAAAEYAVLGPGKRLRPVLTLLCCEAVGGERDSALPGACAMELIHCFSLVHDDLPALDNDDLRRGRPTLHVHAGEAMAILAGDLLLSLAFELVSSGRGASAATHALLTQELAYATTAMIAGQVYDTLGGLPERLSQQERLRTIHRKKTGALITAACRMGAICGGADRETLDAITVYGKLIGLMFQIVDDLIDATGTAEHAGKATGKDHDAGKLTFPGLLGIEASREEVRMLHGRAVEAITPLGESAEALRELSGFLARRTR